MDDKDPWGPFLSSAAYAMHIIFYISYYTKSNSRTIGVWKRYGTAHNFWQTGGQLRNSARRKWSVTIVEKMPSGYS
jgi:hypothetical protein